MMPDGQGARRPLEIELPSREFPLRRSSTGRDVRVEHQHEPIAGRERVVAAEAIGIGGLAEVPGNIRSRSASHTGDCQEPAAIAI